MLYSPQRGNDARAVDNGHVLALSSFYVPFTFD